MMKHAEIKFGKNWNKNVTYGTKNYEFEIVNVLIRKRSHVRELAKTIGTNHATTLRKINSLYKKNVLDYKTEGKNDVYFIKKTLEAKSYIFMTERYKVLLIIGKYPSLRKIFENLQKDKRIKLAILFGSYAKESADKKSDIDIFVEGKNKQLKKDIEMIDTKLSVKIGKFERTNPLIKEIEKNYVIIKGVETFYERRNFFAEN